MMAGDLVRQHRRVADRLRGHKRALREHRNAAQAARIELDQIEDECARLGISVVIKGR